MGIKRPVSPICDVIYQTREGVFHQISKHGDVGLKNEAQPSFFKRPRGVWISDETYFRVFDMASQMINCRFSLSRHCRVREKKN